MKTFLSSNVVVSTVLIVSGLFLTACSTSKPANPAGKRDDVQATRFWKPYLLYILTAPHPRLYVEVDAVAGCEPSESTLNKLRDFLTTYCHKPEGIEIVRNDVIPANTAQGLSRAALTRNFLNGPPSDTNAPPTAFMYLLFYDGLLCDQSPLSETIPAATTKTPAREKERNNNPHVDFLPYPAAAFINTRYGPKLTRTDLLLHEAGHLLGLANRTDHAANSHCLDNTCRMHPTIIIHLGRRLLFQDPIKQHNLCTYCDAQLRESAKLPAPDNLRFVGPVLVRSENGYHVLSLPFHMKLFVGNLTEADCHDFADTVRTQNPPPDMDANAQRWDVFIPGGIAPAVCQEILKRAKNDPLEMVRIMAAGLETEIKKRKETPRSSGP